MFTSFRKRKYGQLFEENDLILNVLYETVIIYISLEFHFG